MEQILNSGADVIVVAVCINLCTALLKIPIKKIASKLKNGELLTRFITFMPVIFGLVLTGAYRAITGTLNWDYDFIRFWLSSSSLSLAVYAVFEKFFPKGDKLLSSEEANKNRELIEKIADAAENRYNLEAHSNSKEHTENRVTALKITLGEKRSEEKAAEEKEAKKESCGNPCPDSLHKPTACADLNTENSRIFDSFATVPDSDKEIQADLAYNSSVLKNVAPSMGIFNSALNPDAQRETALQIVLNRQSPPVCQGEANSLDCATQRKERSDLFSETVCVGDKERLDRDVTKSGEEPGCDIRSKGKTFGSPGCGLCCGDESAITAVRNNEETDKNLSCRYTEETEIITPEKP